jgi:hypothetical protein
MTRAGPIRAGVLSTAVPRPVNCSAACICRVYNTHDGGMAVLTESPTASVPAGLGGLSGEVECAPPSRPSRTPGREYTKDGTVPPPVRKLKLRSTPRI